MKNKLRAFSFLFETYYLTTFAGIVGGFLIFGVLFAVMFIVFAQDYKLALIFFVASLTGGVLLGVVSIARQLIPVIWHLTKITDPTKYLGENYQEIKHDVLRSNDGKRQLRTTFKDVLSLDKGHSHLETLRETIVVENNVEGETDWILDELNQTPGTCLIAYVKTSPELPKVKHYLGLPPELTSNEDQRVLLPQPQILIIDREANLPIIDNAHRCVFLYRFTEDGDYVGDTWHQSLDDAKAQAMYEYGVLLTEWHPVPPAEKDIISFALNLQPNPA